MPKRGQSTLSGLVDISSDEDSRFVEEDTITTPESTTETMDSTRTARGKSRVIPSKVTKSKSSTRRTSGSRSTAAKVSKRKVLAEKTNQQNADSDEEGGDESERAEDTIVGGAASVDELDASMVAVKRNVSRGKSKVLRTMSDNENDGSTKQDNRPLKRGQQGKARATAFGKASEEIQETQVPALEVETNEDVEESTLEPVIRQTKLARATSQSRQPTVIKRRAGSASDAERNEPATRRKLGEITKKFENLDLKYRNLREIGVKEAEHNFERFKKQTEESSKAATALISSLKAEIAAQNTQVKEARTLKNRVQVQDEEISKLQEKITQLTTSLSEAQVENKTLSTKLAANRTAASTVESANTRTPGNPLNGGIRMMGSAEAAQVAQIAQLKEDLYSDLTGLIIRGVKRETDEDVYDCIQTGRNGTLHFKLAVSNEKSSENYEDAQGTYIPQLDPSRDKMLVDILPDYLVEEIYFPRPQAAKFYARVFKALTEKQA